MRTGSVAAVAAVILAGTLVGCSHEVKPDHRGVFVVTGDTISEMKAVKLDMDFTPEGFAMLSFTGDPTITIRPGDFYFMTFGDYRPFDVKAFAARNGRWEEDSAVGSLAGSMQVGGVEKEPEMYRCRLTKPLSPGTYALAVQQGENTLYFPFKKVE